MTFSKKWKTSWELKSLSYEDLLQIIKEVIAKQLDEVEKDQIQIKNRLIEDYDADSVDIVAMLLSLEELFKNVSEKTRMVVPTDKLGEIIYVEDLFDIIYEVLLEMEQKINPNEIEKLKPNLSALEKQKKMGNFWLDTDTKELS